MTLSKGLRQFIPAFLLALTACKLPSPDTINTTYTPPIANPTNGTTLPPLSGANVLPLTVNGSTCSSGSYINKPCVSVTVCSESGTNCRVISDLLVDTGSYGLRVFSSALGSALNSSLTQMNGTNGNPIATCVQYGDGSKQWGPVKKAQVTLGGEAPITVPIQVVDSSFTGMASRCSGAMSSPASGGFNGILGVGLFAEDCGIGCALGSNNGRYFTCDTVAGTCSGSTVSIANQVQNPVAHLPVNNNGVVLMLPDVPEGGAAFANGYLVLGIGTDSNNVPDASVSTYFANANTGQITTTFLGTTYDSFLDSGTNALAFPNGGSQIPICNSPFSGWFCPSGTVSFSAVNESVSTGTSGSILFSVGRFPTFVASGNDVSKIIAGSTGSGLSGLFDWGLPFYFGRNIYHGIEGKVSSLGVGPYWAY